MDSLPPVDLPPATPLSVLETKGINGPGSVSDEEGFLSGEEDFQFASESPVAPSSDDPFAASTDTSMPTAEGVTFSEAKADDEEKEGEKVLEEDGLGNMKGQSNGFHDSGASGSVVGDTRHAAFDTRQLKGDSAGGFEGVGDSKVSLVDKGEKLERNGEKVDEVAEVSKEPDNIGVVEPDVVVVDGVKLTPEGDSVVDAIDADVKAPGIAVVGKAANIEPAKPEREPSVDVPVIATENTDETDQEELKSVEPDVVIVDDVKLTTEGDSVVDAIDADVKAPGIAVVGKAANLEPAKPEREPSVNVPVIATENTVETNQEELKPVEHDMVIVDGVKLTPEGDSVVDAIDADVKAPGIAVVGKASNIEPAIVERELPVDVPVAATDNTDETNQQEVKSVEPDVVGAGVKLTPEGDSVVDAIDADVKAPGIAVVGKASNIEPAIVERELPVDVPVAATDNTDETNQQEVKSVEPDVVGAGVKLTPEGDSVVDAIDTDVKVPGIAVVGTDANVELPKVEKEIPVDVPVVEPDNTDERNQEALKSVESDVVEVDGDRLTTEGDSFVDAINADVKIPGNAIVGKSVESESAKVEEFSVGDPPALAGVDEDAVASKISGVDDLCVKHDIEDADQKPLNSISAAAEAGSDQKLDIKGDLHCSTIVHDIETVVTKDIEETPEVEIKEMAASEAIEAETSNKFENDKDLDGNEYLGDTNPVRAENSNEDSDLIVQGGDSDEPDTKNQVTEEADLHGSDSDEETDGLIFGSSEAAKQFIEQLEQGSGSEISHHHLQEMDGQVDTDSDEEVDTDDEGESKELLDPSALAALLKAATGADADGGGGITITSQDGTRLFSVERPAGLGSSLRALRPNPRQTPLNLFAPTTTTDIVDSDITLTDEEKKTFEKLQHVRVKYLRLIHRLGLSPDDSVPAQVLYRLMLIMGRQGGRAFTMDAAKSMALQLEAEEGNDLDLSLNILVLGKCGVGKSATINSIFGEEKAHIDAFQPATDGVREIVGYVNGVKLRVFDTPGLKCSVYEQSFNRSILSSVKRATKKHPLDIVLYVDRMDSQTRDMNDVPLLKTISSCLGSSIWKMTIITLTHAASAPPDGPSGSPLSYDVFATQRSHVLQQTVSSAAGEIRMLNPSLMHPVALVENHPSCRKNREGQKVLPNGLSWRPQLLLLCYSLKILAEVNSISKPQDTFDHRKIFGFRGRSPPLPYMLSSMLQSRAHPKLPNEQGGDNGDSDIDLDYFSDPDQDEEDEYDQLPPFKPLKKTQVSKLSKEQRRAYFEEYDYRVKLLQKKQLKDELQRMKEMKNKGKDATVDYGYMEEDADSGAAAPVAVPLPDMVLPPSFDADNPAYRYRFLEPTSQFLARPVLDTHGWDHDCGYDGVNVEQGLAIANRFPAAVTFQITKDKKDFTVSLDSSVSAKHGENGSSMAGFDIQSLGKQLAYTLRGETKFKILKKNKTSGGISVTFLGDNIVSGAKLEDQITIGKQYVLVGSAGTVRSDRDTAYGANFELQRREADFPIGQAQSTFSMSLIKWRGDLALGVNSLFQFSVGRGSKVAIRAGLNNKLSGQITVKTSSSEHLSLALTALIPIAASIYKKLQPSAPEQYALY